MKTLIKIFTILFLLTITVNSVDAKPKPKKGRIETYKSDKHKKAMSKKAHKAWKNMCKNTYFYNSAFNIKIFNRLKLKRIKRR